MEDGRWKMESVKEKEEKIGSDVAIAAANQRPPITSLCLFFSSFSSIQDGLDSSPSNASIPSGIFRLDQECIFGSVPLLQLSF